MEGSKANKVTDEGLVSAKDVVELRNAAARLLTGIVQGIAPLQTDQEHIALDLEAVASDPRTNPVQAQIARMVASNLRG